MSHELLNLSRRRIIFQYISKYPGTYIREMEKNLSLALGNLQYHLQQLENAGLISSHDDGRRRRYFVNKEIAPQDREILSLVKMRTPRRIITFLLLHPESTFTEILSGFSFTKGALSFQMKRLVNANIVVNSKREKETVYRIRDEEGVGRILVTYRSGILDDVLNEFVDLWIKL